MNWHTLDSFPVFPPLCACCLVPTTGTLEVVSQLRVSGSMMRPADHPWPVPYCPDCQRHVGEAWQTGGQAFRKAALIGGVLLLPFTPFHVLFLIALILVGSALSVVYGISRMRMRAVKVGSRCTSSTLAVLRKGPVGDRYAIGIRNLEYERQFAIAGSPVLRA